jgi:thioredoxin-like negative regulator of GroEL
LAKTRTPLTKDVVDAFLKHATANHGAGKFNEAAELYEHVEAHNPDVLAATYFRAMMDVEVGRLEAALERLRRVVRRDPRSLEGNYSLGYTYQELGLWTQAAESYRRVLAIDPRRSNVKFMLATALEVLGRMPESLAVLRELASDNATRLHALARIAQLQPGEITAVEMSELQAGAENENAPSRVRTGALFALGEMLEREGRYDDAFAAFAKGNANRRAWLCEASEQGKKPIIAPPGARPRKLHPDVAAQEHINQVAFAKATFTSAFLAEHAGQGIESRAPIFIVGMPRSGSTLIEQILSSHGKVTGLGECAAFWATVGGRYPYAAEESPAPDHFAVLAEAYLERLRALGWRKTPFVVDKMLGNYLNVGLIHTMLPNAVILHSRRDPVDTCLAAFRKVFKSGNETTYDLAEIGAQYVRYREMMAHWEDVLPGRVVHVRHEDLVGNPDCGIRWLVTEACKLKWDDDCLRFHKTTRPVRTASIAQVRQPIFKTSIERWRRYEKHLGPLFEALGPYAPAR